MLKIDIINSDVIALLPTGYRKSLSFEILPFFLLFVQQKIGSTCCCTSQCYYWARVTQVMEGRM